MTDTAATVIPESTMPDAAAPEATATSARRQIRGSGLLMIGRFLSLGLNFLVHVLIVRFLSETDYGAFAYALSLVTLGETVITLGLDRAVTRFIPIYDEQKDYARVLGTLVLVFGTVVTLGIGLVLVFWAFQGQVADSLITDPTTLTLMTVLVFLSPLQALDTLFNGLFTVFSSPRAIFLRRYVMGPVMRLLIVGLLILTQSGVQFLAYGYLFSGVLIIVVFGVLLVRILQQRHYFEHLDFRNIRIPARTVLAFTMPLLASDLLYVLMNTVDAVLLEHFNGTSSVGAFRAVLPMARLNSVVLASFALLYTPAAARLFARGDQKGISELYWQNSIWTAIISFPIFALTFSLAAPLTTTLLEERYADSAVIMAVLALGYYVDAAFGQSGLTLKVLGKVRYILVVYLTAAAINVVLNIALIPHFGALGAAIGTTLTLIGLNVLQQIGLRMALGINVLGPRYRGVYAVIAAAAAGLLLVQIAFAPSFIVSFVLAAAVSLLVLRLCRRALRVEHTFPELLRIPGVRWLLAE